MVIIEGDLLRDRFVGLQKRYDERRLVPFASRQDNDDVACWDVDTGKIVIIHDFASPGFEQRAEFSDFYAWLRQAVEDLIALRLIATTRRGGGLGGGGGRLR